MNVGMVISGNSSSILLKVLRSLKQPTEQIVSVLVQLLLGTAFPPPNQSPLEMSSILLPLVSIPMLLVLKKLTPSNGFVTLPKRNV